MIFLGSVRTIDKSRNYLVFSYWIKITGVYQNYLNGRIVSNPVCRGLLFTIIKIAKIA